MGSGGWDDSSPATSGGVESGAGEEVAATAGRRAGRLGGGAGYFAAAPALTGSPLRPGAASRKLRIQMASMMTSVATQ